MVNYRRVACELVAVAALVVLTTAAPTPDCDQPHAHTHYDQRQNGTENYRLNIDGVVIAVAPAETLMSALSDMDDLFDFSLEDFSSEYKPKPPSTAAPEIVSVSTEDKPQDLKPQESMSVEEKPSEVKPSDVKPLEDKPQESKPEAPLSDVSLSSDLPSQKKDASVRKQEKTYRLKNRLASFLVPLLRKTRHH